ncbi:MAG: hypothetical protein ABJG23_09175 [Marinobacter sp.]
MANQAAQGDASRDSRDAREWLLQKSQLVDEAALWGTSCPQRHWILRGRIPHILGYSPADIQTFVGESFNVTARVATQLRSVNVFDVTHFGPCTNGPPDGCLTVAGRLELARLALIWVFSVGVAVGRR